MMMEAVSSSLYTWRAVFVGGAAVTQSQRVAFLLSVDAHGGALLLFATQGWGAVLRGRA